MYEIFQDNWSRKIGHVDSLRDARNIAERESCNDWGTVCVVRPVSRPHMVQMFFHGEMQHFSKYWTHRLAYVNENLD